MELDDLLDELPHSLARKVARALSPDPEDDDDLNPPEHMEIRPYVESPGPCPVSWRYDPDEDVDTDYRELLN